MLMLFMDFLSIYTTQQNQVNVIKAETKNDGTKIIKKRKISEEPEASCLVTKKEDEKQENGGKELIRLMKLVDRKLDGTKKNKMWR